MSYVGASYLCGQPTRMEMTMKNFPDLKSRLFAGVFPAGISWADKAHEENGDYKRVAFLSYETLKLDVHNPRSPLLPMVREEAAKIQARRGEHFQVSTCGQTVLLGGPLPLTLCAEFRADLKATAARCGKTPEQVYALWRKYAADCSAGDQSAVWSEFLQWYEPHLTPAEYHTDCPACLSGRAHSQEEHDRELKRVWQASAEDYPCSDAGYEDACASACGPGL